MDKQTASLQIKSCLAHLEPYVVDDKRHESIALVEERPLVRFPGLVRYVLAEVLGLHCEWWPWDKVRWRVRGLYKGQPVAFEDRKLGFAFITPKDMPPESRADLWKRVEGSVQILTRHLRSEAKPTIDDGRLTVVNSFWRFDARYKFFRARARVSYESAPPRPVQERDETGQVTSTAWDPYKPEREGGYYTIAMLHEYFSRLEHLMIIVLPSVLLFAPGNGRLRELMSAGWKEKFRAIFDLNADQSAKRLYERLYDVKESLRNPEAHGGFQKDGASAWFHYEGIGALPLELLNHDSESSVIALTDYQNICSLVDEVDGYFDGHPQVGYGMIAARRGLDPKFDPDSLQEYRGMMQRAAAASDRSVFERYLEGLLQLEDMHTNYEDP